MGEARALCPAPPPPNSGPRPFFLGHPRGPRSVLLLAPQFRSGSVCTHGLDCRSPRIAVQGGFLALPGAPVSALLLTLYFGLAAHTGAGRIVGPLPPNSGPRPFFRDALAPVSALLLAPQFRSGSPHRCRPDCWSPQIAVQGLFFGMPWGPCQRTALDCGKRSQWRHRG